MAEKRYEENMSEQMRISLLKTLNSPRSFYPILSCQDMVLGFPYQIKGIEERMTSIGKSTKEKLVLIVCDTEISEATNQTETVEKIIFLSDSFKSESRESALNTLFADTSRNLYITLKELKTLPNKTIIPDYVFTSSKAAAV